MPIIVNGTTINNPILSGVALTEVYARKGETGTYVLVFRKGGVTTVALWFGGNWKMNKVKSEIDTFFGDFLAGLTLNGTKRVIIFPPACYLDYVNSKITSEYSNMIKVGIQNLSSHDSGSYTGQISAKQAVDCNCSYALLGEGEVRAYLGVTDADVAEQMNLALQYGLTPIVVIGEPLEVYDAGTWETYLSNQITTILNYNASENIEKCIIGYQPLWAIGTGKTMTTSDLQTRSNFIRAQITQKWGAATAAAVPILSLYSVKANNAQAQLFEGQVDGFVVTGASLTPSKFLPIINNTQQT